MQATATSYNNTYSNVGRARVQRSVFDLSYDHTLTCDMGQLIPVALYEVIPGDVFFMKNQIIARMQPTIAPILTEINIFTHWFFVPYRLLDENWETFITKGISGDEVVELPLFPLELLQTPDNSTSYPGNVKNSLWDYFGFPMLLDTSGGNPVAISTDCAGAVPLDFPRRAYIKIWNDYYRDQNMQAPFDLIGYYGDNLGNPISPAERELLLYDITTFNIMNRSWEKDYFTSALPFQQRGTAPALPISGSSDLSYVIDDSELSPNPYFLKMGFGVNWPEGNIATMALNPDGNVMYSTPPVNYPGTAGGSVATTNVSFDSAVSFTVSDMRLAFQIQKWQERNARAGVRYTEFLKSHFGVSPTDERLDRAEYIHGHKQFMHISEVLQTSSTDAITPQGNMAGHGLSADQSTTGKYKVQEFGVIMCIMSVLPRTSYNTQGVHRSWLRRSTFDFPFPEFSTLSEQPVYNAELYASDSVITPGAETLNMQTFGFQGRYNEMRSHMSQVSGDMRDNLSFWHMARQFSTLPYLNTDFITSNPTKRIFSVENYQGLIMNVGNAVKAVRPLPSIAEPGLIDHH